MVSNPHDAALDAELAAMQQIAAIVGELDAATRARVLRWAAERFMAIAPAVSHAAQGLSAETTDETLSVAALDDFFDCQDAQRPSERAAAPETRGRLQEFVAEFQDRARNVAGGAPADVRPVPSAEKLLKTAS